MSDEKLSCEAVDLTVTKEITVGAQPLAGWVAADGNNPEAGSMSRSELWGKCIVGFHLPSISK